MWPNAEGTNYAGPAAARKWNEGLRLCQLRNLPPVPRVNLETDVIEGTATGISLSAKLYASLVVFFAPLLANPQVLCKLRLK